MKKKILTSILAFIICLTSGIWLGGCDNKDVTFKSMALDQSTLNTTVEQNSEVNTSGVVVVVTYSDHSTKRVTSANLTFSHVDTSEVGTKTLRITYEEKSVKHYIDVEINVVEAAAPSEEPDTVEVLESMLWNEYESRNEVQGKALEYMDKNDFLYAGTDNKFNFRIAGTIVVEGQLDTVTKVPNQMEVTVSQLVGPYDFEQTENNQWDELTQTELDDLLTINNDYTISFKNAAIDQVLQFKYKAVKSAEGAEEKQVSFTAVVKVAKGFNVYDAQDLSMFDDTVNQKNVRDAVMQKYGLDPSTFQLPNALFLQADIEITPQYLGSYYFYDGTDQVSLWAKETFNIDLTGSAKNHYGEGVYKRTINSGTDFMFNGNYFNINASGFPLVVFENEPENYSSAGKSKFATFVPDSTKMEEYDGDKNYITSFQSLFWVGNGSLTEATDVFVRNMHFTGNSAISDHPQYSGGLMQFKSYCVNLHAYNTISKNFYVTYFPDAPVAGTRENKTLSSGEPNPLYKLDGHFYIDSCKAYDSYQCIVFSNNAEQIVISNCEFDGSGGPAIIADHDKTADAGQDTAGNSAPGVDIYNSKISSWVTKDSPWLASYDAGPLINNLVLGEGLFSTLYRTNKTILKNIEGTNHINLIALIKNNDGKGNHKLKGYIRIFETEEEYKEFYGITEEGETVEDRRSIDSTKKPYGLDMFTQNGVSKYGNMNLSSLVTANVAADAAIGNIILQGNRGGIMDIGTLQTPEHTPNITDGNWVDGINASKYCNVYIFNGMGAIIGLEDKAAA